MDLALLSHPGQMIVLCGPHGATASATPLIVELALRGDVMVLDGGNHLPPYRVVRWMRARHSLPSAFIQRLQVRRAFTAYQMLALLENTPTTAVPCVILDLLVTFYDETLDPAAARYVLVCSLEQLARLRSATLLLVTLSPPPLPQRRPLFESVCRQADALFFEPENAPLPQQLRLL